MTTISRRNFLRAAVGVTTLGAIPASIQRALAIPANNATGTIQDVGHVILFMQENRSFDHYFGMLPGVRGYSDRFTIPAVNGSIWYQNATGGRQLQPYYLNPSLPQSKGAIIGGAHSWSDQHAGWDHGRMAGWPLAKSLDASVGYLVEDDLPYHWALANTFTLCDAYFTSQHCGTFPNRTFMWSGTNGANVSSYNFINNDGIGYTIDGSGALGDPSIGMTWATIPELLQKAGISWKLYQRANDNSNNNQLFPFRVYRQAAQNLLTQGLTVNSSYSDNSAIMENVSPFLKGVVNTLPSTGAGGQGDYLETFANDVLSGNLAQVTWLVAPAMQSEHPGSSIPDEGAYWIDTILNALTANPDVWSKTVLFIPYDENDGFFDHLPPPNPPSPNGDGTYAGKSTVDVSNEYYNKPVPPINAGAPAQDGLPYGPCVRVPMMVISPWSVGGWVNSQAFDHTSMLQFLGQRFGIPVDNVSPWRRTVFGDLTGCFDFTSPNSTVPADLSGKAPSLTQANATYTTQNANSGAVPPADPAGSVPLPQQPLVLRPSRALPYHLHASSTVDPVTGLVYLTLMNTGTQGAVLHVYDQHNLAAIPRRYTVGAGKMISDSWTPNGNAAPNAGLYSLWVLGPNGFHRLFEGDVSKAAAGDVVDVRVCYNQGSNSVSLTVMNTGSTSATVTINANAYVTFSQTYTVDPGNQVEPSWNLDASQSWYDFTLTIDGDTSYTRRFAGRLETGKDGVSDPAMGVATA
ncbi:phosphocholine-specific phospholipase C [Paraburkholderia ferrariae]|uniref:phosphocholine-specific phospholipase C n=1 Tax=Paraburkholderia ferrariae TaxID=386056 RepID=UPI000486AE1E|nr:phospholipase C, phosphocholine-specific [Paraburkholderia ferrariae]